MDKITQLKTEDLGYEVLPEDEAKAAGEAIGGIVGNIETVIKGKHEQVELVVLCLLAEGHVLIEDIPGVGKTSLVSSLAKTVDCEYKRIQFTPDVMPSDVTGFSIYNQKSGEFEFRPGAAMSNIVLADEISPDTCRLWDEKTHEKLDKDRFRRDLGNVLDGYRAVLARIKG